MQTPPYEWAIKENRLFLVRWMRVTKRSKHGHVPDKCFVVAHGEEQARKMLEYWAKERGKEVYLIDSVYAVGGKKSRVIY